jgi:hypothetical protein
MTDRQTRLRAVGGLDLVEADERNSLGEELRCPDCHGVISDTKGGQPLPDDAAADRTFGWYCDRCENVIPSQVSGPTAPTFNDRMIAIKATFRDGTERWIPTPKGGGE